MVTPFIFKGKTLYVEEVTCECKGREGYHPDPTGFWSNGASGIWVCANCELPSKGAIRPWITDCETCGQDYLPLSRNEPYYFCSICDKEAP